VENKAGFAAKMVTETVAENLVVAAVETEVVMLATKLETAVEKGTTAARVGKAKAVLVVVE